MEDIYEILERLKVEPDTVFQEFQESLDVWEECQKAKQEFIEADDDKKIEIVKDAYIKKIKEQSVEIVPSPEQGKDYCVFIGTDPSSGETIIKFEAYSEIGQILMRKMEDSMLDIDWDDIEQD